MPYDERSPDRIATIIAQTKSAYEAARVDGILLTKQKYKRASYDKKFHHAKSLGFYRVNRDYQADVKAPVMLQFVAH